MNSIKYENLKESGKKPSSVFRLFSILIGSGFSLWKKWEKAGENKRERKKTMNRNVEIIEKKEEKKE